MWMSFTGGWLWQRLAAASSAVGSCTPQHMPVATKDIADKAVQSCDLPHVVDYHFVHSVHILLIFNNNRMIIHEY
jgi:hypothetical protein